ncbi:MAG: hypothetical protein PHI85_09305 [Victivallaceae bacterium]|nr:hypothetical protein [Victivallaceae bacterium]
MKNSVIIRITETDNGHVNIESEFNPPLENRPDQPPTHIAAMKMICAVTSQNNSVRNNSPAEEPEGN